MRKKISGPEIIRLCEEGKEEGWEIIHRIAYAVIAIKAKNSTVYSSKLEDIVQYSMLKTIEKGRLGEIKDPKRLVQFIFKCAQNDFHDYIRENKMDMLSHPLEFSATEENSEGKKTRTIPQLFTFDPLPEFQDKAAVLKNILKIVKEKGGEKYFGLLKDYVLGFWAGEDKMKLKELALKHGIPLGSVKTIIERMFKQKILIDPEMKKILGMDLLDQYKNRSGKKTGQGKKKIPVKKTQKKESI